MVILGRGAKVFFFVTGWGTAAKKQGHKAKKTEWRE